MSQGEEPLVKLQEQLREMRYPYRFTMLFVWVVVGALDRFNDRLHPLRSRGGVGT